MISIGPKRVVEETQQRLQISEEALKQRVRVLIYIAVLLILALAASIFLQMGRHETRGPDLAPRAK